MITTSNGDEIVTLPHRGKVALIVRDRKGNTAQILLDRLDKHTLVNEIQRAFDALKVEDGT